MKACSIIMFAAACLSSGCASLTNNTSQAVVVRTTCGDAVVQGATCRIINPHGSWAVVSTPGAVMITKAPGDLAVSCTMPNVVGDPVLYESHATLGTYGNIIIGGLVGFGIDSYRDAAWGYHPEMSIDICRGQSERTIQRIQSAAADNGSPAFAVTRQNTSDLEGMRSTMPSTELRYAVSAEDVAKQRQCAPVPRAILSARGPATEVYTVPCVNGDALMMKCTWGECKVI